MKKVFLSPSASKALEAAEETKKMYRDVAEEIKNATLDGYKDTGTFQAIKEAAEQGLFSSLNQESISYLADSFHEVPSTIQLLKDSLREMAKPDYYLGYDPSEQKILANIDLATKYGSVDTSWFHDINIWDIGKETIAELDFGLITGEPSRFSELCRLEQEVSRLGKIPNRITSTTVQIASIVEAIDKQQRGWLQETRDTITQLLNDYSDLATKQYEQILKAGEEESKWRLGVIEAASRYVDRQVTWSYQLADRVSDEEVEVTEEDKEAGIDESALPLLPSHIGYTRRIDKTPIEGLEESSITSITEKGKAIADNIITINSLQMDKGQNRIFSFSEKTVGGLLCLSSLVCNTADHLGKVIDALFFMFYENIKHIKILIGQGNEEKGDQMVRNDEIFQCIFDIKTLRNDLRHDLNHGSENEIKKKMKNIGECYKKYCGNRPLKPKDYKILQNKIYDNILKLEEMLIQISCCEDEGSNVEVYN